MSGMCGSVLKLLGGQVLETSLIPVLNTRPQGSGSISYCIMRCMVLHCTVVCIVG